MKKELRKIRSTYTLSGSPAFVKTGLLNALVLLNTYLTRLSDQQFHLETEFAETISMWLTKNVPAQIRPQRLTALTRKGLLALFTAIPLTLTEMAVFTVLSISLGVYWVFAVSIAFLLTVAAKAFIYIGTDAPSQPLLHQRRILRFVFLPAGRLFLLSGCLLLFFSRTDAAEATVVGLINVSLFLLSLACLGISAALFALANHWLWSLKAERRYNRLELEKAAVISELHYVCSRLRELGYEPTLEQPPAAALMQLPKTLVAG